MTVRTQVPRGLEVFRTVGDDVLLEIGDLMHGVKVPSINFNIVRDRVVGESFTRELELKVAGYLGPMLSHAEQSQNARRHHVVVYSGMLEPGGEQRPRSSGWHADMPLVSMEFLSSTLPARILTRGEGNSRRAIGERTLRFINDGKLPGDDDIEQMIDDGVLGEFSAEPGAVLRLMPGVFHKAVGNQTSEPIERTHVLHAFSGNMNFRFTGFFNVFKILASGESGR